MRLSLQCSENIDQSTADANMMPFGHVGSEGYGTTKVVTSMKRKISASYWLYLSVLIASLNTAACGTLVSLTDEGTKNNPSGQIYGGVKMNIDELQDREVMPILKAINIIDLPLSAILDTAFLPFTWWYNSDGD